MMTLWRRWRLVLLPATLLAALTFTAGPALASGTDLALNHPTVASSTFSSSFPSQQAVDGNTSTRWAAAQNKLPDALYVDLGSSYNVNEVKIQWGADYPTSYSVQTSPDASTWTTIYSTTAGNGGTDDLTGLSGTGRYVKVVGNNQNDSWGNSIYELYVYGSAVGGPDTTAPTVPTNVSVTANAGASATVSWTASNDNGGGDSCCTYNVYRDGGGPINSTPISGTSFTDNAATENPGTDSISYSVEAIDATGNKSAQSSPTTIPFGPTTPTGLTASPGNAQVALSWNASTDPAGNAIEGYEVYRNGVSIALVSSPTLTYTDTGLTNGTQYSYQVLAYESSGLASTTSAPVYAMPTAGGGSHTVPATPDGPATPSGGWSVVYGDAFGSCLPQTTTMCSSGYARSDPGWTALTNANGDLNPNEIDAFEPSSMDVTSQGLVTHCTQTANLGDAYTCGTILGNGGAAGTNSNAPTASKPFQFQLPSSDAFVIQYQAQLPANQGNMDPTVWENSVSDNPEVDNAEYFGMHQPPVSGSCGTWTGDGWAWPAIPFGGSMTGNGDNTFWCGSGGPTFDPSAAEHIYTMEFNKGSYDGYVDGNLYTSGTYSVTSTAWFKFLLGMSMRKDAKTGLAYALPSGGNTLTIPYIAVYAPTSQGTTGTSNSGLAPGTTVQ